MVWQSQSSSDKVFLNLVAKMAQMADSGSTHTRQKAQNKSKKQPPASGSECYKTKLVTIGKAQGHTSDPTYSTTEVGISDESRFQSVVTLSDGSTCSGAAASSKKKAEQEAAKAALKEVFHERIPTTQNAVRVQKQQNAGPAKKRKADAPEQTDHKHKLAQSLSFVLGGEGVKKGDLIYSVQGEGNVFTATVTIPSQGTSFEGTSQESRKLAEQSAAEAALEGMRELFAAVGKTAKGKKEKGPPVEIDQKHKLAQSLSYLLGGEGVKKTDLLYSVQGEGNVFTATVTIPSQGRSFEGTPQESRKLAEHAAAEAALEGMSEEFAAAEATAKAKKEEKFQAKKKAKLEA